MNDHAQSVDADARVRYAIHDLLDSKRGQMHGKLYWEDAQMLGDALWNAGYRLQDAAHDAGVRADQAEKTLNEAADALHVRRYGLGDGSTFDMSDYYRRWLRKRAVALTPTTEETEQ